MRRVGCRGVPLAWATLLLVVTLLLVPASANATSPVVALNDPDASGPTQPTKLGPGGTGLDDYVQNIKWTSWGGSEAIGKGGVQACIHEGPLNAAEHQCPLSPVTVTLGGLVTCVGNQIYTCLLYTSPSPRD